MDYSNIIFYSFFCLSIISSILVIFSLNPVHSVLFLILTFTLCAGVLLLLGVEFLGIIYIVVYVGAIAVLFLFVVMMLNIRLVELTGGLRFLPISGFVSVMFLLELYYILKKDIGNDSGTLNINYKDWLMELDGVSNLEVIGSILYTYGVYMFLLSGVILLVSMIGTIVLTLTHELNVKRQEIYVQTGRSYELAIKKVDIRR